MKISVIIPVYNAHQYIEECIASVVRQTLKDLEILCVDDGSVDGSLAVLHRMQEADHRIRIIIQENQGSGMARNNALKRAEGEFVFFLDADDYLMDDSALERMYQACMEHHAAICGAYRSCNRNGTVVPMGLHRKECEHYPLGRIMTYKDYQYDFHYSTYIYQRKLLTENQIFFPDYRRFQDPPFFVKAMLAAKYFFIMPIELYCFRAGHQDYTFSHQKVNDIVRGITDVLEISVRNDLKALHLLEVSRLNEGYFWNIVKHLTKENQELLQLLVKANGVINWGWIEEKKGEMLWLIRPLQFCLGAAEEKYRVYKEELKQKGYEDISPGAVFPFHKVPIHSRIVLYAAGTMGWNYYRQIKDLADYELAGWVDKQYKQFEGKLPVISPVESIHQMNYDYIVIAVEDESTADSIKAVLRAMGIAESRIIWSLSAL